MSQPPTEHHQDPDSNQPLPPTNRIKLTPIKMPSVNIEKPTIAARLKGPGPAKYKLPGTTGFKNHDGTKKKMPAFSLGKRFSTTVSTVTSLLATNFKFIFCAFFAE